MKKPVLFVAILFFYVGLIAQNIVPNGNFERRNTCQKYQEQCTPSGWRSTTLKLFGYLREEGRGSYIKLLLYDQSRKDERKFAQTKLICPLEKGHKYLIRLKIKPNQFWINQLGVGFSENLILSKKVTLDDFQIPYVSLEIPKNIIEGRWYILEIEYLAKGNEKYLVLGNLLNDALTKVSAIDQKKYKKQLKNYQPKLKVQYGFDDVEIIKIEKDTSLCEDAEVTLNRILSDNIRHSLAINTPKTQEISMLDSFANTSEEPILWTPEILKDETLPTKKNSEKIILKNLLFGFNEATLLSASIEELDKIAIRMKNDLKLKAKIIGFTDNKGSTDYNLKLSFDRASAVKKYLRNRAVAGERLTVEGRGEATPIANNDDEQGQKENRRVEVEFYY